MAFNPTQGRKQHFCGHCNRYLNKTLFYRHKQLYYDTLARTWNSERVIHPVVVEDKEFSCDIRTPDASSHDVDEQPDFLVIPQPLRTDSISDLDTALIPADHDSEVLSMPYLF